jgi:serine protease Do
MEAGMITIKSGCKSAIAVFWVCLIVMPLSAQTRVFSNILQSSNAYLGIQMEDVTSENVAKYKLNGERGVIIRSIVKGSPAEAAKFQADDVILEFGGTQVWSAAQMTRLVQETPIGRKVDFVVSRGGKRINLTAPVKERDNRVSSDFNERFKDNQIEIIPRDPFGSNGRTFQYRIPGPIENRKPKLGVTLQPLTDQLAEYFGVEGKKGVLVSSVAENSTSSGKLNPGDVIISVDGKKIGDAEDLIQVVREKSGAINLKVVRNKKEITVVVTLPEEENQGRDSKGYKL